MPTKILKITPLVVIFVLVVSFISIPDSSHLKAQITDAEPSTESTQGALTEEVQAAESEPEIEGDNPSETETELEEASTSESEITTTEDVSEKDPGTEGVSLEEGGLEGENLEERNTNLDEDETEKNNQKDKKDKKDKDDEDEVSDLEDLDEAVETPADETEEAMGQSDILEPFGDELIDSDYDIEDKKKIKEGSVVTENELAEGALAEAAIVLVNTEIAGKNQGDSLELKEALEEFFAISTTQEDLEETVVRSVLIDQNEWIASALLSDKKILKTIEKQIKKGLFENVEARVKAAIKSGQFVKQLAELLEDDKDMERFLSRMLSDELQNEIIKQVAAARTDEDTSQVLSEKIVAQVIEGSLDEFNVKATITERIISDPSIQAQFIETLNAEDQNEKEPFSTPAISVQVSGPGGSMIVPLDDMKFEAGSLVMKLDLPRSFTPGIYRAAVEIVNPITGATEMVMQDFGWGILAMNTDQDTYKNGSKADIHIGVLDNNGVPVCDAILDLNIQPPTGAVRSVDVTNTGTCETFDASNVLPDYQANYNLGKTGAYLFNLTATLPDGNVRNITRTITVDKNPSFTIERIAATRLYPVGLAPMTLNITFDEAFTGNIVDVVPSSFKISDWVVDPATHVSPLVQAGSDSETQTISWSVTANAGETKRFYYLYDSPDISPEFYTVGPLEIRSDTTPGQPYYEQRQWNIANDEPSIGADSGDELLGHWPLNTGSGTSADDSSTYANDGTLTNMESGDWTTNTPNTSNANTYALDFDGTDEYVTISDPAGGELDFGDTDDFTITGWVNRDTFTTDDTVIAKRNGQAASDTGYSLYIDDSTDHLTFEVADGTDEYQMESKSDLTTTGWVHFAVVWDQDSAANSTIHIDGASGSLASTTGTIGNVGSVANGLALNLGAESDGGEPLDGKLDDVRVYNRILTDSEIAVLAAGNTPAGISSGLELWLRADDGVTVSGSDVTDWLDQSGNGNDFDQNTTANQPDLTSSAVNSYAAITFDGSNDALTSSGFTENPLSVFAVIKNTDTGSNERTYFGMESNASGSDDAVYMKANDGSGNAVASYLLGGSLISSSTTNLDNQFYLHAGHQTTIASSEVTLEVNGDAASNGSGFGSLANITESAVGAGFVSDALSGYFQGDIAEILVYSTAKTGTDRQKIESYLGLKYGLTLDQSDASGGTTYIDSDGGTIWAQDTSDEYENDVAGIGQDDAAGLFHTRSKSEHLDAILFVSNADDQDDLEFLSWANDDGSATWTSTGAPTNYKILTRQWQFQEAGDVGTVDIEFDVQDSDFNVPTLQGGAAYFLIYDSDDDGGLSDETPVAMKDDGTNGDETSSDNKWTAQIDSPTSVADGRIDFTLATQVDPPPTVTDGNISINSGSGTSNTFIVGDEIVVTWDNSASGDNNSNLVSVTANLTGWGGNEFTTMTDTTACGGTLNDEVYEACFTLVAGNIDNINVNASVNASNLGGQTATGDSSNATVDNEAPTVSTGSISITGATGASGEFIAVDTPTGRWDNSASGDNNSDTISSVSFDLSDFRSTDSSISGSNATGIWTGSTTGSLDTQASSNNNVTVSVTDDAGNSTVSIGTNDYTIDSTLPSISSITSVAGDTSAPYYDTTDDSSTEIVLVSADSGSGVSACKWDTTDTSYTSMSNTCSSTTSCTTALSGNGSKTIYIRCADNAGNPMFISTQVDYMVDSVAPSGVTITPNATRIIDISTPSLTVDDGSDTGSGIDTSSRVLERQEATYSNNACGTFGAFTSVGYSGTYPTISDTGASGSKCYRYRWSVSDDAGNTTTSGETATVVRVPLTTLAITGGNNQSYGSTANPIGYTLPTALQVQVTDGGTNTAENGEVEVDFSIISTPTVPTAVGQAISAASATTDASGYAEIDFTLGDRAGDYQIEASSIDAAVSNSVTFTETADNYFDIVVVETSLLIDLDPVTNTSDYISPVISVTTNAASFEIDITPDQWPSVLTYQILNWASSLGFGWSVDSGSIVSFLENMGDPAATNAYACSGDACQGANVIDIDIHAGIDFSQEAGLYTADIDFTGENINY